MKVSIVTTHKEGLVVGVTPGNPCDGRAMYEALRQAEILSEVKLQMAFVDRVYRALILTMCRVGNPDRSAVSHAD
jgi:IS5 family transposase